MPIGPKTLTWNMLQQRGATENLRDIRAFEAGEFDTALDQSLQTGERLPRKCSTPKFRFSRFRASHGATLCSQCYRLQGTRRNITIGKPMAVLQITNKNLYEMCLQQVAWNFRPATKCRANRFQAGGPHYWCFRCLGKRFWDMF